MFAEEKPHLQPLPLEPFRYYQYAERTVHLDGCIEVAYYGAPPGWIGRKHASSPWASRSGTRSHQENQTACNPSMPAALQEQPML